MKWTKAEKDFVDQLRVARLATSAAGAKPHVIPICPLFDKGRIYVGSEKDAKKVRNVRDNPEVAIVFDEYTEDWSHLGGVLISGQARVVSKAQFRRLRKKMYAKYLQYPKMAVLGDTDSVIVEITPRRKSSWGFERD